MGVEPTQEGFAPPYNGFEDRGAHQDSITPRFNAGFDFASGGSEWESNPPRKVSHLPTTVLKTAEPTRTQSLPDC
jgi:hypothetical protein